MDRGEEVDPAASEFQIVRTVEAPVFPVTGLTGGSGEAAPECVDIGGLHFGAFREEPQFGVHAQGGEHARFEQDVGNVGGDKFIEQEGDIHSKFPSA